VNVTIRPAAREDILRQFRYYLIEKDADAAAKRFLEAVEAAIEDVARHPEMGVRKILKNPVLQGLRTWPVKGFPSMRIYYLSPTDGLRVVRVLHGRRDVDTMLEEDVSEF
jgi:toxin ParE1/3/4